MSAKKVVEHIQSSFSISTTSLFKCIRIKKKSFCESLREHEIEILNFDKRKKVPLTNKEYITCRNEKFCYICIETFEDKFADGKNIVKLEIIIIKQEKTGMLLTEYAI